MGAGGCQEISAQVTMDVATSREQYDALLASGAPTSAYIDAFVASCSPAMADLVREELRELPSSTVDTIVQAWAMAATAGKRFVMQSVRPERPMEFARERRVRIALDLDEEGVTLSLSHIPGRHATWYQPVSAAA